MTPEFYGYDAATLSATESANRRIDSAWWYRWMRNLKDNDADIRRLPRLSHLFGAWRGPCLVAAAGPSLDSNLDAVREAQALGWRIIAVDKSFNTLKRAGVRPDITVTCDAGDGVAGLFDEDLVDGEDTIALCVISHPGVYRKLEACACRVFACINPFSAFWKYVQSQYSDDLHCLRPGYVVTFSAVDLAQWMGAGVVVTIGNELCWPGIEDVAHLSRQKRLVQLPDGRITIPAFERAARAFRFFPVHHPGVRFVDASDGIVRGWERLSPGRALRLPADEHIMNEVTP